MEAELGPFAPDANVRSAWCCLDNGWLKAINDQYGHLTGSRAICAVGKICAPLPGD